jgi:hypothetical protein
VARARAKLTARAVAASLMIPAAAWAQRAERPTAGQALTREWRAELTVDRHPAATVGGGLLVDAGSYVRVGVLAGVGATRSTAAGRSRVVPAAEAALVGRFLLDPVRDAARGVYAGGGLAVRAADGDGRPFVLLVLGVEGRAQRGAAPAVELGVGRGARLSIVLRRARPGRR